MEGRRPVIHIFLYRKGNGIVPTTAGVYGTIDKRLIAKRNFSFKAYFDIKRSEIITMDKPKQRCNASNAGQSLSMCIGSYIEKKLNCSLKMLMSHSIRETCNISKTDFNNLERLLEPITTAEEREIFEMTGCMPGCTRSKFELTMTSFHDELKMFNDEEVALLRFKMPHGEHELLQEYYLYTIDSLIPDVGGYLGLLLGYSLLGMYHKSKKWLINLKIIEFFRDVSTSGIGDLVFQVIWQIWVDMATKMHNFFMSITECTDGSVIRDNL